MQPTPTQAQAMDRHRAFHQKIAERAAAIGLPVQECEVAPSIVPKRVEIVEHKEPETYVPIIACGGQVVYVTFDSVVEALRGGGVDESIGRRIRTENIQRVVGERFGVSRIDLLSSRRTANVVRPRQVAMYLAKTLTVRSLPEIGRRFGGRDHTTVLHAVRKIERLLETDSDLKDTIEAIKNELGAA